MHLIELKEKLDGIQAERGNVLLSHARIAHEDTLLVDHNGGVFEDEDHGLGRTDIFDPELEAFLTLSLEERLAKCRLGGVVPVSGEELVQLLEYRDELKASYDTGRTDQVRGATDGPRNIPAPVRMLALVPPAGLIEAARDQLRSMEVAKRDAQLKELHVAIGDSSTNDAQFGYNLGLETARVCLDATPAVQLAEATVTARPVEAMLANKAVANAIEAHVNAPETLQE